MTKQELIQYILRQLGSPVIHIEIAQEQIEDVINDALDLFREYHADALKLKWKDVPLVVETQDYTLDSDVFAIVDIYGQKNLQTLDYSDDEGMLLKSMYVGNTGFFNDQYRATDIEVMRQTYQLYMSQIKREYLFDYSYLERNLKFLVDIDEAETVKVLCQCFLNSEDSNFSSYWFRKFCTAHSGLAWAQNIGKYSSVSLPGGGSFNYQDIFSKYNEMRQELEEQIVERYSDTLFMEIG